MPHGAPLPDETGRMIYAGFLSGTVTAYITEGQSYKGSMTTLLRCAGVRPVHWRPPFGVVVMQTCLLGSVQWMRKGDPISPISTAGDGWAEVTGRHVPFQIGRMPPAQVVSANLICTQKSDVASRT